MYQESAAEGPADAHTSPKKPILADFRRVCTRLQHCKALSVYISGMCSSTAYVHPHAPRQKPPPRQAHIQYVPEICRRRACRCTYLPQKADFSHFSKGMYTRTALQGTFRAHTGYVQAAQRTCIPTHQGKSPLLGRYIPDMCSSAAKQKARAPAKAKKLLSL